jgi:hypothetical protein
VAIDTSGGGTVTWNNYANVTANDGNSASAIFSTVTNSNYIKATNFGFSIPTGKLITGIAVFVNKRKTGSDTIKDDDIKLVKGGEIQTVDKAESTAWLTTPTLSTYGGVSDLWGGTWTVNDVNNSGFGVVVSAKDETGSSGTALIDYIGIIITYTDQPVGGGGAGDGGGASP